MAGNKSGTHFCYQRHDGDARHTASSGKIRHVGKLFSLRVDPLLQPRRDDPGVLARLKPFNLPCIVVDDGAMPPRNSNWIIWLANSLA